jgi:hypothetical protein
MNQEFYFVIVNNDKPIYEFPTEDKHRYLKQFIAYSALDIIDELEATSTSMYLKALDKFNEWTVYAFVPNKLRILLLITNKIPRVDESFFIELYQTYTKFATNPLYIHNTPIKSAAFDRKVSQIVNHYRF